MGILGQDISSRGTQPSALARSSAPAAPQEALSVHATPGSELARRRDRLAREVTELHWDLGGLAYEMAIRDHFRLDVLVRRAAVLQERDAELAEVERLLRVEADGTAGACPQCGAPHSRGAVFCWQCGTGLMQRMPSAAAGGQDDSSVVMDALLAPLAPGQPSASADE
ncbi:MAG TPA: zinc ribbon domain-containing protein [Solirubrobacteraceae bacterium]|jgi:hypothetical protein|nr:zinc ribbon domain-containing protein [Solirubrobacteraceae bacterium]